jgi:PAS domain S-box-containing protein
VILDDASALNPFSTDEYIREQRPRSVLCLPLVRQGVLVALLYMENNLGPSFFAPGRIAVLKVLASQAAISLDNSRLYRELQEREAEIRRLVDANIVGIFIWELDGQILEANDAFLHIVGYEREDLLSGRLRWTDLTPAEWLDRDLEKFVPQLKLTGKVQPFEKEYFRKGGSRVPVLVGAAAFDEECKRGVAFVVDLTGRKRAEEAAHAAQARLEGIVRIAEDAIISIDSHHRIILFNQGAEKIFGYVPAEAIGRSLDLLLPERLVELHRKHIEDFAQSQDVARTMGQRREVSGRRKDGSEFPAEASISKLDHGGDLVFTIILRDVTERKRAEQALRRSEFYLAEGQRLGHAGSWSFKPDGTCDYWSRELYEVLGFDPKNGIPTISDYFTRVHPEDRTVVGATIQNMIAAGEGCDLKKRIIRPDGAQRVIRCVGMAVREQGLVTRFVGTLMDITEQEALTQELRRREAYLAEAQRLSHTGSFGWDVSSGQIYWSDETFRIFELEPKTTITTDLILQRTHPDDRQAVQQLIERASSERTEFVLEHRLLMPDGSIKYLRVVGRLLQDEGRRSEFVGAVTDITDQRRAEESLRKNEAYLAEAQKLSKTGSWAWSPDQDIRYWSEECYRVLSFNPQDGLPRFEEFFQRIHPDDQSGFRELIQTAIREKAEWEADYRIVHLGGGVRDIHVVGHPVLSTSGHLVEFGGTVIDVTERKSAEAALQEARAELERISRVTMMGELAASIAHEINQPLAGVVTSANAGLNWLSANPPNLAKTRETLRANSAGWRARRRGFGPNPSFAQANSYRKNTRECESGRA